MRYYPKELSIKEIAREVGTDRVTTSKYLAVLEAEQKIEQTRSVGNAKFYRIRVSEELNSVRTDFESILPLVRNSSDIEKIRKALRAISKELG